MHIPVLLKEVVEYLPIPAGGILVDGTLGEGGHSLAIAKASGGNITILGIDRDKNALLKAKRTLQDFTGRLILKEGNYRDLPKFIQEENLGEVSGIFLDLGYSSNQIDAGGRGFSFQVDEPLLMTYEAEPKVGEMTAEYIVNNWDKENLIAIIRNYGEEKHAKRIAEAIVSERAVSPIKTSLQLSRVIEQAIRRRGKVHPATKTFQALRIAVNDEIRSLRTALAESEKILPSKARIAVISFHSLEDREVKQWGRDNGDIVRPVFKKPIVASAEEVLTNPRSRSAKLRVYERK